MIIVVIHENNLINVSVFLCSLFSATAPVCRCVDLKSKKSWICGETWSEDCFDKHCVGGKIELTPVVCPKSIALPCPRERAVKVSDGCCETWKCDCK